MTIICRECGASKETPYQWIELDETCDQCQAVNRWRRPEDPIKDYDLSRNDKLFLRSMRINPE